MVSPPSTLCGVTDIAARPGAKPTVVASTEVVLADGSSLTLTELEWQLAQFEIADRALAAEIGSGSINTFVVALPEGELHLQQSDSSFWSSSAVRAEGIHSSLLNSQRPAPQWRKRSNRYWPHVGGVPAPFIGQAHLDGSDIYLFRVESGPILAHRVGRFEQDVEDHYGGEGCSRGAT
jgi:hypothetical protein